MALAMSQSPCMSLQQRSTSARSMGLASASKRSLSLRSTRMVVRAENKSVTEQAEDAFQAQAQQVKETVVDPLAEGTPATAPENAWDQSIIEAGKAETEKLGTQISIPDAMRFRGIAPETINSRLAMIGVTTGFLTKWITGENTFSQYAAAPLPVILTFITFIVASLIPITKGVTPEKAAYGIWQPRAEIINGRLAMLGFASLLATDGWQMFIALQQAKGAGL